MEDELTLAGHSSSGYCSNAYTNTSLNSSRFLSTVYFHLGNTCVFGRDSGSNDCRVDSTNAVRPVISLVPGTDVSRGDGSADDPLAIKYYRTA